MVSNLLWQLPVAGPDGAPGALLAPAPEPVAAAGGHTRGLAPAPTRRKILAITFITVGP